MKLILSIGLLASLAFCQEEVVVISRQVGGPPGFNPVPDENFTFFANGPQKLVKNAPYMADSITESVQTLADGNRILHTNKSSFARDSEGRTRRESNIQSLGNIGSTEEPIVLFFIDDPVAKLTYSLDPRTKVALKSRYEKPEGVTLSRKTKPSGGKGTTTATAIIERDVVIHQAGPHPGNGPMEAAVFVPTPAAQLRAARNKQSLRTEDLGTKTIEGVSAHGTRTTMTIPAGEAGNERPMEVVTETWYSEELKTTVLNVHTDPRMGTVTTRLANVRLGEPARSLFDPPADYKIEEGARMRRTMPMVTIRDNEEI
jgi:hypothetical protein